MNFCGCVDTSEREIRGKGKDIKKRYTAKKPGKKSRKETNVIKIRGSNKDRDLSYDFGKPFNDDNSNVSILLPNSNNLSAISDNNVTRGTFQSQNESNNQQSFSTNLSASQPLRRHRYEPQSSPMFGGGAN